MYPVEITLTNLRHTMNASHWVETERGVCNTCMRCGRFVCLPIRGSPYGAALSGPCPDADFTLPAIPVFSPFETPLVVRIATTECPICGAKQGRPHHFRDHDRWRDRVFDSRTRAEVEADREACGAFAVDVN